MRKNSSFFNQGSYLRDFSASIVVFLVALPLCMGIAIASGAPVAAGLITGIVGGIVVGMLAGAPLQVSGPAAGLSVLVYEVIQRHGFEMLGPIVLIAGAIQIVAGCLGLGQWFRAVSPAVIKGMLTGIGVLILASQFHVMVDSSPKGSGIDNLIHIPDAATKIASFSPLEASEQREVRTTAIRTAGQLVAQQQRLVTRSMQLAAERDANASESETADGSAGAATEPLQQLIADQRAVVTELAGLEELLAGASAQSKVLQAAHTAASEARERGEAAVTALEQNTADAQELQAQFTSGLETLMGTLKNHSIAGQLGLLTIGLILLWQAFIPSRLKLIPPPLVAILAATAGAFVFSLPVVYVTVPDNLLSDVHAFNLDGFTEAPWLALFSSGLIIAIIASAETLLCATAVDQMHNGARTRYDRELTAQGVGNAICGLLGALPMTGVIVRSSANVHAGAQSRLSAILHGVWLLVFVSILAGLLRLVPTASLAAVLVYTGYKLIDVKGLRQLWAYDKGEALIFLATVSVIVAEDLLVGVVTGVVLSALKLLYRFSYLKVELELKRQANRATLHLEGSATFLRLPQLAAELERVPAGAELHVELQQLEYVDHACLDLLMQWAKQHEASGGKLVIDWDSMHARFRSDAALRPARAAAARVA